MASPSILKLSDLTLQIRQTIDGAFGGANFWVIADISSHTYKPETNQHYFELVEKDTSSSRIVAKVAAKAWGNAAVNIANFEVATGQKFKNDINALMLVTVQYHLVYGLQLNLIDIDTNFTLGRFEQQRSATLIRLVRENPSFIRKSGDRYVTKNSELNFKKVIQHIAVISSFTSAGFQDFEHTLLNNPYHYVFKMNLYLTKVQGEENAKAFLEKLIDIFNSKEDYDAVVIIRGGGAQSDFLLFDNYELSRAIAKFPIPVITGIGHQKNETIVDLMAHTPTKTPTKAAEMIISYNRSFEDSMLKMQKMMIIKTQQLFALHTRSLNNFKTLFLRDVLNLINEHHRQVASLSGIFINRPKVFLNNERKNIKTLMMNVKAFSRNFMAHEKIHLKHYQSIVKLMSPQNILNKGFAIIMIDGEIINNAESVRPGNELTIQMARAEIKTTVKSKKIL